jgi:hypothetical protein
MLAASDLSVALGVLLPDPRHRVEIRAESVHLQLPPEDQKRLDESATPRKEDGHHPRRRAALLMADTTPPFGIITKAFSRTDG